MKIELYQVPHLLLDSSTYLGSLSQPTYEELNVNLNNLRRIELLLPLDKVNYNYIKVIESSNMYYYYILDNIRYHNGNQRYVDYRLDVFRTVKELSQGNIDLRLTKFSEILTFNDNEKESYFYKNQDIKLGAEKLEDTRGIRLQIHNNFEVNRRLNEIKWVYIWLQPKARVLEPGLDNFYQYKIDQGLVDKVIELRHDQFPLDSIQNYQSTTRPLYIPANAPWDQPWADDYIVGQLYKDITQNRYVRYEQERVGVWPFTAEVRRFVNVRNPVKRTVYLDNLANVSNQDLPNSAYCIVLPTKNISVFDQLGEVELSWSVDNVLPFIMDVGSDNNWISNMVDLKISNMPPIEFNNDKFVVNTYGSNGLRINVKGNSIEIPGFKGDIYTAKDSEYDTNDIYIPSLITKPEDLIKCAHSLPSSEMVSKSNLIYKKYYLSVFENRVELDLPKLMNDGATQLYLYEDIQPGRSSIILGFAPSVNGNIETLKYLIHSGSALSLDRDLSLPTFNSSYESYISNNKNFIKQAELSRNTQLQQGLINSGSQVLGASAVSLSMEAYNPANSMIRAAGSAANTLISYNAQKKQFGWSVENMKGAPGSYKNASTTTSMILTLMMGGYWLEVFTSNDFDKQLYDDTISEIGYNYYDMRFKLSEVFTLLNNQSSKSRGFIQGRLIGVDFSDHNLNILSYILNEELNKGVKIYT